MWWHGQRSPSSKFGLCQHPAAQTGRKLRSAPEYPFLRPADRRLIFISNLPIDHAKQRGRIYPNSRTLLATRSSAMSPRLRIWGACRALAIRSRPVAPRTEPFINTLSRNRWYSDQSNNQPPKPIENSNKTEETPKGENTEV